MAADFSKSLKDVEDHLAFHRWLTDPEYTKNLRHFHTLVACAESMVARTEPSPRLDKAIDLSERPETLEALLGRRFALEQLLAEIGDEQYLRCRSAAYYSETEGTNVTWQKLFEGTPPPLRDGKGPEAKEQTRLMLQQLLAAKEMGDLPLRARRAYRQRALFLVVFPLLAIAAVALLILLLATSDKDLELLLAPAAGAAGAAVGGLVQLRDKLAHGTEVREFRAFFAGQVMLGMLAGILVYLVNDASIVELSSKPSGIAAFSFAVGFSEAAFIGLLSRLSLRE